MIANLLRLICGPRRRKVYLYPGPEFTYSASVGSRPRKNGACLLTVEGAYPASVIFSRTDLNGCLILEEMTVNNDQELLETLDWAGKARWYIRSIWDFPKKKSAALYSLLGNVWEYRIKIWTEIGLEALSDDYCDEDTNEAPPLFREERDVCDELPF